MNQNLQKIYDFILRNNGISAEEKNALTKAIEEAEEALILSEFKLSRTEQVKKTTEVLLEETIDELEKKRKDVEAKNRELEIETALERVRAIAMAMRKPEDLLDVCEILFKELQTLGFEGLRNSMINIHNDDEGSFLNYDYSDFAGPAIATVNYNTHPTIEYHVKQTRSADDAFFEYSFTGSQLNDWKEFRKKSNEYDDPRIEQIDALHYYFYSIGTGSIGISTFSGINNDQREILKRFRNVFNLSYQRYMDISLAEMQAWEAQIELALERVRARTMAMQKSFELMETSSVLYQQLKNLGEPVDQFSIGIISEKENIVEVSATLYGNKIQQAKHSIDEPLLMNKIYQHWKNGEKSFVLVQEGKDLIEYNKFRNTLVGAELFPITPETAERRVISVVYFSKGMLALATNETRPKESMRLLERFAVVFDLTYTRFLDLQKAEAQAKEAKIEAALEKVRSRTMGMQKSNELVETAFVLYQQFKLLGETPIQITIGTINEKEKRNRILGNGHERKQD
jgi:hypothetical protein